MPWLWGAPLPWLWDLLEPGLSVQSAWGGPELPYLAQVGVGGRGWLVLAHSPPNPHPTGSGTRQSRISDMEGPPLSVTVSLRALPPLGFGSPLPDLSQPSRMLLPTLPTPGMSPEGAVPAEEPRSCTQQEAKSLTRSFHAFLCQAFTQHGMSSSVLSLLVALLMFAPKPICREKSRVGIALAHSLGSLLALLPLSCCVSSGMCHGNGTTWLWAGEKGRCPGWLLEIMDWLGGKGP